MLWVWVVVLVVVIGALAVVVVGRDDAMAEVYDDRPDTTVPTGQPLTPDDIASVRFTTGLRGYRMDEVDAFLERVRTDLLARESAHHADEAKPPGDGAVAEEEPGESPATGETLRP